MDNSQEAEHAFVLEAFDELKRLEEQYGMGVELRISVTLSRSRKAEIIYCGFNMKKSLTNLRKVYKAREQEARTFGAATARR